MGSSRGNGGCSLRGARSGIRGDLRGSGRGAGGGTLSGSLRHLCGSRGKGLLHRLRGGLGNLLGDLLGGRGGGLRGGLRVAGTRGGLRGHGLRGALRGGLGHGLRDLRDGLGVARGSRGLHRGGHDGGGLGGRGARRAGGGLGHSGWHRVHDGGDRGGEFRDRDGGSGGAETFGIRGHDGNRGDGDRRGLIHRGHDLGVRLGDGGGRHRGAVIDGGDRDPAGAEGDRGQIGRGDRDRTGGGDHRVGGALHVHGVNRAPGRSHPARGLHAVRAAGQLRAVDLRDEAAALELERRSVAGERRHHNLAVALDRRDGARHRLEVDLRGA